MFFNKILVNGGFKSALGYSGLQMNPKVGFWNTMDQQQNRGFRIIRVAKTPRYKQIVPSEEQMEKNLSLKDDIDLSTVKKVLPVNPLNVFRERMRDVRRSYRHSTGILLKQLKAIQRSQQVNVKAERAHLLKHIREYRNKRRIASIIGFGELYKSAKKVQDILSTENTENVKPKSPTALHVDREILKKRDENRKKRFFKTKDKLHTKAFSALLAVRNQVLSEPTKYLTYTNAEQIAKDVYNNAQLFKHVPTVESTKQRRKEYMAEFARGTLNGGPSIYHVRAFQRKKNNTSKSN